MTSIVIFIIGSLVLRQTQKECQLQRYCSAPIKQFMCKSKMHFSDGSNPLLIPHSVLNTELPRKCPRMRHKTVVLFCFHTWCWLLGNVCLGRALAEGRTTPCTCSWLASCWAVRNILQTHRWGASGTSLYNGIFSAEKKELNEQSSYEKTWRQLQYKMQKDRSQSEKATLHSHAIRGCSSLWKTAHCRWWMDQWFWGVLGGQGWAGGAQRLLRAVELASNVRMELVDTGHDKCGNHQPSKALLQNHHGCYLVALYQQGW